MPKFIAVHTVPVTKKRIIQVAKDLQPLPKGVTWSLTYCDIENGKLFCVWDAPNKKMLEQGLKNLYIPLDAVYPVEVFNVAKKEFES